MPENEELPQLDAVVKKELNKTQVDSPNENRALNNTEAAGSATDVNSTPDSNSKPNAYANIEDSPNSKRKSVMADPKRALGVDYTPKSGDPASTEPKHEPSEKPTKNLSNYEVEMEMDSVAQTPFVNKVWLIVNNPANQQFIRWVPGGKSILIVDREGFERQLLPYHFKHKRFTSFVRQLNMYGWHKVQDLSSGTMQSAEENWQFANPNFIQGHPELLKNIIRNKGLKAQAAQAAQKQGAQKQLLNSNESPEQSNHDSKQDLKAILYEISQIRTRQQAIGEDLARMRKDNELLWNEYYQTRERHDKHSQVLGRILRFLATIYGNQSKMLNLNDPIIGSIAPSTMDNQQLNQASQYLSLLPESQSFESGIHELREIEQLQHQINETSTPGSSDGSLGVSGGRKNSNDSNNSNRSNRSGHAIIASYPENSVSNPSLYRAGSASPAVASIANGASNPTSRALIRSRQGSQQLMSPTLPRSRRVPNTSRWASSSTDASGGNDVINSQPSSYNQSNSHSQGTAGSQNVANNQLVRAAQHKFGNQSGNTSYQVPLITNQQQSQQHTVDSPQLHEIVDEDPQVDPSQLFAELGDYPVAPPLTSQELDQITRDVANNGMSLQNIQEWLSKQNLESDEQFNVDDFLLTDDIAANGNANGSGSGNGNGNEAKDGTKAKSVDGPDTKRVKLHT